jgi:uncharacterized membrane protein
LAQEAGATPHKTRIESLSDLIFGLALSIGALTLIGESPSGFEGLVLSIGFYAFSFLILISVWYSYTRTMAFLRVETDRLVSFNILLLFLVSIEPFLFNQLITSSMSLVENVSIIYAFDLGGLFAIEALFTHSILSDKNKPGQVIRDFRLRRNTQLAGMALFFISALPVFWTWAIPVGSSGIPLRLLLWISTLFMPLVRRSWERHGDKQRR